MAGAFTAVADDASAPVWNPAGLASGSFFSVAVDGSRFDAQNAQFVGVATPPLGLTYYRSATGGVGNNRNSLVAQNLGVSLVQSLGDTGVAVGTTLKWVHGVTSSPDAASLSANKFDADVGVMVSGGLGQVGLTLNSAKRQRPQVCGATQQWAWKAIHWRGRGSAVVFTGTPRAEGRAGQARRQLLRLVPVTRFEGGSRLMPRPVSGRPAATVDGVSVLECRFSPDVVLA
jgi:hypothetical protein